MAKKKELSGNALIVLAVLAFFISVIATSSLLSVGVTGLATGYTNVTIPSDITISISVPYSNFTNAPGDTNTTQNDNPAPIKLTNDGSDLINLTVASAGGPDGLFSSSTSNTSYQYRCNTTSNAYGNCTWNNSGGANEVSSWTNASIPAKTMIDNWNFTDATDDVELEIKIIVPGGESAGGKYDTLTFTAYTT